MQKDINERVSLNKNNIEHINNTISKMSDHMDKLFEGLEKKIDAVLNMGSDVVTLRRDLERLESKQKEFRTLVVRIAMGVVTFVGVYLGDKFFGLLG